MNAMEKGKKAERIVEDMFKEAGFKVVRYGYEYTLPQLADRSNLLQGRAARYIRHQPDLIVINKKNEAFFVEVKFRTKQVIPDKDIFPYPDCYVVLLTENWILAQSTYYLFRRQEIFQPITKMPPFEHIPDQIIEKYVQKVRRTLGTDTLMQQWMAQFIKKHTTLEVKEKDRPSIQVIHNIKENITNHFKKPMGKYKYIKPFSKHKKKW